MIKKSLPLLLILILTFIVYFSGLNGPLIFDDQQNLAPITQWLNGKASWGSVVFDNGSGTLGRPVSMASFLLNAALFAPDPSIWAFKLGNLLLHLLNGYLVYALFAALLRCEALTRNPSTNNHWLPILGAGVWLVHPLLASTVLYVVQRMAMLSAFFLLLAMLVYLQGRIALIAKQKRKAGFLLGLALPACIVLATLSKENGVLGPALCAIIELVVFMPKPTTRRPWLSQVVILVGIVLPALIMGYLLITQHPIITSGYINRSFTLWERLLTEPRVLWNYISSLIMPYGPRLGLYHDDYLISLNLFTPFTTVLALAGWVVTLVAAWRLRRRIPGFALGIGIFLIGHALESTVFPLMIYFEHRNYLPSVGALWAVLSLLAYGASYLAPRMHRPKRLFATAGIALVLMFSIATAARAYVWQSKNTLFAQGLQYHPNSRLLRMALIHQAMEESNPPRTQAAREHAEYLSKSADSSTRRLGNVFMLMMECEAGTAPSAMVTATFAGRPEPVEADLLTAFEALSVGVMKLPCKGLSSLQMANQLKAMLDRSKLPHDNFVLWRLRFKTAQLYSSAGMSDQALQQGRLALASGTTAPAVPVWIAGLLLQRGELESARKMLILAEQNMREDDVLGRELLKRYRGKINKY